MKMIRSLFELMAIINILNSESNFFRVSNISRGSVLS